MEKGKETQKQIARGARDKRGDRDRDREEEAKQRQREQERHRERATTQQRMSERRLESDLWRHLCEHAGARELEDLAHGEDRYTQRGREK
jgi:hypothetical protein